MRWPWTPRAEISISDPAVAALLGAPSVDGVEVSERTVLGLSAMYRAVSLVSGQLGSLPLVSYRQGDGVMPEPIGSVFDDPDGPDGQTVYEWKETAFAHLMIHGRCGGIKLTNDAGSVVRIVLFHPMSWQVRLPTTDEYATGDLPVGGLWFDVSLADGSRKRFDQTDWFYVPALSLDGKTGVSLIHYARTSLGATIAGDKAAGNMFASGALISGLATPDDEEDITNDVPEIRRQLDSATSGWDNAGKIAVINRRLKIQPWSMTAVDAQFLQSRQFQIEEISRWSGVPPHLLMQTDKQTSWGTGVEMQDRALGRTVLGTWAARFEQRASRLLARPRWCAFDFAALERPTPEIERAQIIADWTAGLITLNEARGRMKLPPMPGGDTLKAAPAPAPAPDPKGGDDDPTAE
jgi:HK97 family phage portal protein